MGLRCTSCGAPLPGDLPHAVVESRCSRCRTGSAAVANTPQPAPARTDNPQGRGRAILLIALLSVAFLAALIVGLTICLSGSGSPEEEKHGQVVQGPPPVEDSSPKKADTPLDLQPVPPPLTPAEKERNALHHSVTFMDSVGKGRRFCIIADSSNSMKGPPLERCKQEVLKTLKSLTPESQFYVSFFNKVPEPMPYASWLDGNKANVDKVTSWVEKITPALGTKPVPAFTKAFQLKPRPDVIFFMTDGLIPAKAPEEVATMNKQQPRVTINTIMFIRGKKGGGAKAPMAEKQLRLIAEQSGGAYRLFVPGN